MKPVECVSIFSALTKKCQSAERNRTKLGVLAIRIQFLNWIKCSFEQVFNEKLQYRSIMYNWRSVAAAVAAVVAKKQQLTAAAGTRVYSWCFVFIQFDWATRTALSANILRSDSALINQASSFNMFSLEIIFGQTSRSWWRRWLISVWSLSFGQPLPTHSQLSHSFFIFG